MHSNALTAITIPDCRWQSGRPAKSRPTLCGVISAHSSRSSASGLRCLAGPQDAHWRPGLASHSSICSCGCHVLPGDWCLWNHMQVAHCHMQVAHCQARTPHFLIIARGRSLFVSRTSSDVSTQSHGWCQLLGDIRSLHA